MGFINKIRNYFTAKDLDEIRSLPDQYVHLASGALPFSQYSLYTSTKNLQLSAVYRCVNLLSDSVASLQLKPYLIDNEGFKTEYKDHNSYSLLGIEPNQYQGRFMFFKNMIVSMLLRGNAYIYVSRTGTNITNLQLINPDLVTPQLYDNQIYYNIAGFDQPFRSYEIVDIPNFISDNSLKGTSTITHASMSLETAYNSEQHASNFFESGANLAGILKTQGNISQQKADELKTNWQQAFSSDNGQSNGIAVLPGNVDYIPVSISAKDAQLLETRKYNVSDIARFFNVPLEKLYDNSNIKYNSLEQSQLSFLTDSLTPLLEKIENEFHRKLFSPGERKNIELRFDLSNLLRADQNTRADYYTKMFQLGAFSPNDIRQRENMPKIKHKNGDKKFIQVNVQDLENIIYNPDNQDNKAKQDENK